jgi:hypothetical protein
MPIAFDMSIPVIYALTPNACNMHPARCPRLESIGSDGCTGTRAPGGTIEDEEEEEEDVDEEDNKFAFELGGAAHRFTITVPPPPPTPLPFPIDTLPLLALVPREDNRTPPPLPPPLPLLLLELIPWSLSSLAEKNAAASRSVMAGKITTPGSRYFPIEDDNDDDDEPLLPIISVLRSLFSVQPPPLLVDDFTAEEGVYRFDGPFTGVSEGDRFVSRTYLLGSIPKDDELTP